MDIFYNGQALAHAPTMVAEVSDQPLQNNVAYTVSDELAALLLERDEWGEAPGAVAEAPQPKEAWAIFKEIDRVDDQIARAMWDAGYRSREDVAQAVIDGGWKRLTRVSGIGDARAQVIADWALPESEIDNNG